MDNFKGIDFIKKYWKNNQYGYINANPNPNLNSLFFKTLGRLMDDFLIEKTCVGNEKTTSNEQLKYDGMLGDFKSGFFDLENTPKCNHPEHEPPRHLHIPEGKGYRHRCPNCGKVKTIVPPQFSY